MKKWITVVVLIITLTINCAFAEVDFPDVKGDEWYAEWVGFMKSLKLTSGYPDGTYRPNNKVKRIEMLSFAMKVLNHDISVNKDGYWGQNIIDVAIQEMIIKSDDLLATSPDEFITREETAKLIYSAYLKNNQKVSSDIQNKTRQIISDIDQVNSNCEEGVIGLVALGIVEGYKDKSFKPRNHLTRAESAVFISRLALPNKRVKVVLDMPTFKYETKSFRIKNFSLQYNPIYQDIYNILSIIDHVDNSDVTNSFAAISPLGEHNGHTVGIYPSMKELDEATSMEMIDLNTWRVNVERNDVETTIKKGEIQINTWREANDIATSKGIQAVVKYLFGDDHSLVWNKILEFHSSASNVGTWERVINGRKIIIYSVESGIVINISRIDNAPSIDISRY